MTSARKRRPCSALVAAVAAGAGAVVARQTRGRAAAAAAAEDQTEASGVLDAAQKALEGLERGPRDRGQGRRRRSRS